MDAVHFYFTTLVLIVLLSLPFFFIHLNPKSYISNILWKIPAIISAYNCHFISPHNKFLYCTPSCKMHDYMVLSQLITHISLILSTFHTTPIVYGGITYFFSFVIVSHWNFFRNHCDLQIYSHMVFRSLSSRIFNFSKFYCGILYI